MLNDFAAHDFDHLVDGLCLELVVIQLCFVHAETSGLKVNGECFIAHQPEDALKRSLVVDDARGHSLLHVGVDVDLRLYALRDVVVAVGDDP